MILREQDKAAMEALMARDNINIAQAAIEVDAVNRGEPFVIRASQHPKYPEIKARSWTRTALVAAFNVADGAKHIGYEEVHVYYRTSDGFLVEKYEEEIRE